MKNYRILTLTLGAVCGLSAAAGGGFTLSGTLPGVNDSVRVVLVNAERDKAVKIAETVTTDGTFTLADSVKMPKLCKLNIQTRGKNGEFRSLTSPRLMVENTDMKVSFLAPLDSMSNSHTPETLIGVEGSKAQSQFEEYLDACMAAERKASDASYMSAKKYFESNNNRDTMMKYNELKKVAAAELLATQKRFIAGHPDYHISSVLTYQELMRTFIYTDPELVAMVETVKVCPDTARVGLNDRALAWSRKYSLGMVFPDFEVCDTDKGVHPFSKYVTPGKYTFIDFWASWCGPCRSAIPHVRKLYNGYADKMNVYSISCDSDEAAWRKAMDKEQMEWTQLCLNDDQLSDVAQLYLLSAIPRLLLLDPEGRIVCSTNLPDEVDEYLAKNVSL
ncbi:MAG: redoxin domain-containing protein [Bacteroides sp.]|nr:redoxin domain-containing protein [Bacteroides sp.]